MEASDCLGASREKHIPACTAEIHRLSGRINALDSRVRALRNDVFGAEPKSVGTLINKADSPQIPISGDVPLLKDAVDSMRYSVNTLEDAIDALERAL